MMIQILYKNDDINNKDINNDINVDDNMNIKKLEDRFLIEICEMKGRIKAAEIIVHCLHPNCSKLLHFIHDWISLFILMHLLNFLISWIQVQVGPYFLLKILPIF